MDRVKAHQNKNEVLVTCSQQSEVHNAYEIKSFHLDAEMMHRFDKGGNHRQRHSIREGSWVPK